jgi:hypothetical protein
MFPKYLKMLLRKINNTNNPQNQNNADSLPSRKIHWLMKSLNFPVKEDGTTWLLGNKLPPAKRIFRNGMIREIENAENRVDKLKNRNTPITFFFSGIK